MFAANTGYSYTSEEAEPSKTSWWHPKTKILLPKRVGSFIDTKCDRVECDEEYIGQSSRTFLERLKKLLKPPFPIYDHCKTTGHTTTVENFSTVGKEDPSLMRTIKEAIYIDQQSIPKQKHSQIPSAHILDDILFKTQNLKEFTLCGYSMCHIASTICALLNTCGHNTSNTHYNNTVVAITSATTIQGIKSANITMSTTTAIAMWLPFTTLSIKLQDTPSPIHVRC